MANGENNEVVNPEEELDQEEKVEESSEENQSMFGFDKPIGTLINTDLSQGLGVNNPYLDDKTRSIFFPEQGGFATKGFGLNVMYDMYEDEDEDGPDDIPVNIKEQPRKFQFTDTNGKIRSYNDVEIDESAVGENFVDQYGKNNPVSFSLNGESFFKIPENVDEYIAWRNTKTNSKVNVVPMTDDEAEVYNLYDGIVGVEEMSPVVFNIDSDSKRYITSSKDPLSMFHGRVLKGEEGGQEIISTPLEWTNHIDTQLSEGNLITEPLQYMKWDQDANDGKGHYVWSGVYDNFGDKQYLKFSGVTHDFSDGNLVTREAVEDYYKNLNYNIDYDYSKIHGFANNRYGDYSTKKFLVDYGDGTTPKGDTISDADYENYNIINLNTHRKKFIENEYKKIYNKDLKKHGPDKLLSNTHEGGLTMLSGEEKEYYKLQEQYKKMPSSIGVFPNKEKDELGKKLDKLRKELNLGENLYDHITGKTYNIKKDDNIPAYVFDFYEKSNDMASEFTVDDLNQQFISTKYKLQAISGVISDYAKKYGPEKIEVHRRFLEDITNVLTYDPMRGGDAFDKDLKALKKFARTGIITGDLSNIAASGVTTRSGEHPLIAQYNEALNELAVINRAILLNSDPFTEKKKGFIDSYLEATPETLGFGTYYTGKARQTEKAATFDNVVKSAGGEYFGVTEIDPLFGDNYSVASNSYAAEGNWRQIAGGGFADLQIMVGSILGTRRVTGNMIKNSIHGTKKIFQKLPFFQQGIPLAQRSTTAIWGNKVLNHGAGALTEAFEFSFAGELSEPFQMYDNNPYDMFKSGFYLYTGGALFRGIASRMPMHHVPGFVQLTKSSAFMNWQRGATGAAGGSFAYHTAGVFEGLAAGEEWDTIKDGLTAKSLWAEYVKMRLLGSRHTILGKHGVVEGLKHDYANFRGFTKGSKEGATYFGVDHKDIVEGGKDKQFDQAVEKKKKEIENDKSLTDKEALQKLKELGRHKVNVENSLYRNKGKISLNREKGLDKDGKQLKDKDGNPLKSNDRTPTDTEIYLLIKKLKEGKELSLRENETLSLVPEGILFARWGPGMKPGTKEGNFLLNRKNNAQYIEDVLDYTVYKTERGSKGREDAYNFLLEKSSIQNRVRDLKKQISTQKERGLDTERLDVQLKDLNTKLKEYEGKFEDGKLTGGKKYIELQKKISKEYENIYSEKISEARIRQEKLGGKFEEALTKKDFQERFNELDGRNMDVTDKVAFQIGDVRIVNKERALEVRNMEFDIHEAGHFVVKGAVRGKDGKVSKDGIKLIDGLLEQLTPQQRKIHDKEMQVRYGDKMNQPKENWYEENITIFAELVSKGKISFSDNISKSLLDFVPFIKKQGFENVEMNAETGKNLFELIRKLPENEAKAIEEAKKLIKETEGLAFSEDKAPQLEGKKRKDVLQAIKDLVPKNIKTKTQYEEWSTDPLRGGKILGEAFADGGPISNYIRSGKTRAESDKTILDVLERTMKFNPETKRADGSKVGVEGFGERIFADAAWARLTSKKELFEESQEQKLKTRITPEVEQITPGKERADKRVLESEVTETKNPLQIQTRQFTGVPKDLSIKSTIKTNLNFGEISKNYGPEIADQVFNKEGIGKKIFNNRDFTIDEARTLQQYYVKGRNHELDLKTMSEYNVASKTAQLGLENIDISSSVLGRSLKFNNTFLNKYYEKWIDPRAFSEDINVRKESITSKTGRSKGESTQPFVYKLKKKYTKITPDIIKKDALEIGITEKGKSNIPVDFDSRSTLGQLLRGKAKATISKIANEQWRVQRAEQGASKKELADAAAGKRDAQFSDDKITLKSEISKKHGYPKSAAEVKKSLETAIKLNPDIDILIIPSNLSFGGRKFRGNPVDYFVSRGAEDAVTLMAIKDGKVLVTQDFNNYATAIDGVRHSSRKQKMPNIVVASKTQKTTNIERNLKSRNQHVKGVQEILELLDPIANKSPELKAAIAWLVYPPSQKANANTFRNMAQLVGKELSEAVKKGFIREEHMFQYGEFAKESLDYFDMSSSLKTPSGKNRKQEYAQFLSKTYYQSSIESVGKGRGENYVENPNGKNASESILDTVYTMPDGTVWTSKSKVHPVVREKLEQAKRGEIEFTDVPDPGIVRAHNTVSRNGGLNSNRVLDGRSGKLETVAKVYKVEVDQKYWDNLDVRVKQNELIFKVETREYTDKDGKPLSLEKAKEAARVEMDQYMKIVEGQSKASFSSNKNLPKELRFTNKVSNKEMIEFLENFDKAMRIAKDPKALKKGISVFDFDDTLAKTKSKVRYEMPDGTKGELNATDFARESTRLEKQGASFDFSDFNKVIGGQKGPLFGLAQKREGKFTNKDIFVLTARPQLSASSIHMFLKSQGLNIPIENITGLENGSPQAKARWIISKAAKGYNDFYFADDAYKNVKAVQKVLDIIDVKSDVQQAKFSREKDLSRDINEIIEYATGIGKEKTYSKAKAEITGKGKKNWSIYMPNRAGDFYSLTNALLGKGKKGLENREWFKENLSKPFSRGDLAYQTERRVKMADYYALKRKLKDAEYEAGLLNLFKKNPLKKPIEKDSKWTNEHAVRVYNWNKQGILPKDISKSDVKKLVNHVNSNPKLKTFADNLAQINKQDGYPAPKEFWVSEGITQDILTGGENVSRKRHMKEFIDNADIIFSPENLNKMEAALGPTWRKAMEDSIERMKTGTNRPSWGRGNKWESDILDFMNGSISGIMFLNVRSAILQQVSIPNYINVTDNNPFKAAKAFSNFPQFAKDYVKLMNDSWSRNRRDGLRYNIQESEIVEALSRSKNKGAAIIDWALKKGFVLTKYADSHATAFGGASFYRNRLNTYKKKGLSEKEAEERALEDWREMSDGTQQTSRMDRVSQEQKSVAGRLILPFSSVQLAYGRRYIDDPARDLINGRYEGLIKGENSALKKVGQIVYGTVIQGAVFHALQQGVFKVLFEDGNTLDGEELEVANATLDGILVGMGIRGKAYATFKNWLIKAGKELQKDNPKLRDTASDLLKVSPPIDKKYRQIRGALATLDYDMDEMSEISLDNPGLAAAAGIIEASTNAPVDRLLRKMQNVKAALEEDRANWQRPFLLGGWAEYDFEQDDRSTRTFRGFKPRKFKLKTFD